MGGKMQAQIDYKDGLGQDENPFPKESDDYSSYMWEMARLWNGEFQADLQQAYQQSERNRSC